MFTGKAKHRGASKRLRLATLREIQGGRAIDEEHAPPAASNVVQLVFESTGLLWSLYTATRTHRIARHT